MSFSSTRRFLGAPAWAWLVLPIILLVVIKILGPPGQLPEPSVTMRQIAFGNQSWHNYGFYSKGNTDTETHTGHSGWWAQMTDANHWDFYVIVFYVGCSNGKTYAGKDQSNDVQFNWNQVNHHNGSTTGYWSVMP